MLIWKTEAVKGVTVGNVLRSLKNDNAAEEKDGVKLVDGAILVRSDMVIATSCPIENKAIQAGYYGNWLHRGGRGLEATGRAGW